MGFPPNFHPTFKGWSCLTALATTSSSTTTPAAAGATGAGASMGADTSAASTATRVGVMRLRGAEAMLGCDGLQTPPFEAA